MSTAAAAAAGAAAGPPPTTTTATPALPPQRAPLPSFAAAALAGIGALEAIDAPLVRVPLEALKRAAKERKAVVDEVEQALAAAATGDVAAAAALRSRLENARVRLAAVSRAEADEARRCRARLTHLLVAGSTPPKPSAAAAAPAPGIDAAAAAAAASAAAAAAAAAEAGRGAKASRASLAAAAGVGPVTTDGGGAGGDNSNGQAAAAGLDVLSGGFGRSAGAGEAAGGRSAATANAAAANSGVAASPTVAWAKRRLDRLLADYMLRQGYSASAARFVAASNSAAAGGLEEEGVAAVGVGSNGNENATATTTNDLADLLDWGAFEHAPAILAALRARDPAPALAWAAEHRARLRRLKSPLEFRLRLAEFLELVRLGQRAHAVAHARATLAPLLLSGAAGAATGAAAGGAPAVSGASAPAVAAAANGAGGGAGGAAANGSAAAAAANPSGQRRDDDDHTRHPDDDEPLERDPLRLLQRAAATLALGPATRVPRYARLFSAAAWDDLSRLFLEELFRLHGLPAQAPLAAHLQAGLTALKHPASTGASGTGGGAGTAGAAGAAAGAGGAPVDADGDVAMGGATDNTNAAAAAAAAAASALLPPPPSRDDPMSVPELRALAEALPASKRSRSRLVCRVTRQAMDDHNPPLVLPNGYVYSSRGVDALVALYAQRRAAEAAAGQGGQQSGGGGNGASGGGASGGGASAAAAAAAAADDGSDPQLMCPMTGQVYRRSQLRRAYIV
jgi:hypothetical protein